MCKDDRVWVSIAGCDYNRTVRNLDNNNLDLLKEPQPAKNINEMVCSHCCRTFFQRNLNSFNQYFCGYKKKKPPKP